MPENIFERKLHIPRTKEGEREPEIMEQIREFHAKMEEVEGFVGIGLFGSTIKGYSDSSSDIDCIIFYDPNDKDSRQISHEIFAKADSVKEEMERTGKREVNYDVHNISARRFEGLIRGEERAFWGVPFPLENFLTAICQVTTGEKISAYRRVFMDKLKRLPSERQKEIYDLLMAFFDRVEQPGVRKLVERKPELAGRASEILAARRELWAERVHRFLGIPDEASGGNGESDSGTGI